MHGPRPWSWPFDRGGGRLSTVGAWLIANIMVAHTPIVATLSSTSDIPHNDIGNDLGVSWL